MTDAVPLRAKTPADVQDTVARLGVAGGEALLKVDVATEIGGLRIVAGWCSDPGVPLALFPDAGSAAVHRFDRPDVRAALGSDRGDLGFGLVSEGPPGDGLAAGDARFPLNWSTGIPPGAEAQIAEAVAAALALDGPGTMRFRRLASLLPEMPNDPPLVEGAIDHALAVPGAGGVAAGWIVAAEGARIWLEDDAGRCHDLACAHRWTRSDVLAAPLRLAHGREPSGFAVDLPGLAGARSLRICAARGPGKVCLPPVPVAALPADPLRAARALAAIPAPRAELPARFRAVDLPFLARLRRRQPARPSPRICDFGAPPASPAISVVIPLYGRFDFMEHHLLEAERDADFTEGRAELVFVLDDPAIAGEALAAAARWQALFKTPFRMVDPGANLGFAGACNAGAEAARGATLVFLNSDAIPVAPGWATALASALAATPGIGAVGPRLLFAGGGLQHAGMRPVWRPALGLWTNEHPLMGFEPALDPARGPTRVPMVTGACLAIGRAVFDRAGGWSTDYLIGDFEDSDLCLKLDALGLATVYLPEVTLVHLERQSLPLAGEAGFRGWITHLNATLHAMRWHARLAEMAR